MAEDVAGCVHIVEDEPGVRRTIAVVLRGAGYPTREYATADELLAALDELEPGCIITDVKMPGMDGIQLVRHLAAEGLTHPVIVISGQADIPMAVEAIKAGAMHFLEKPLHTEPLRDAVRSALENVAAPRTAEAELYRQVVESLTRRQREVLEGILQGLPNKEIAYRLGLSIRTVEGYRAGIMKRTQTRNLSQLVRLGIRAGM